MTAITAEDFQQDDNTDRRVYGWQWRKKRDRYARRVGNRCERCGKSGAEFRLELHHIDPRGTDDDANLILLCTKCHHDEEASRQLIINTEKHSLAEALAMVHARYVSR